ncbi:hypothetical protein [Helicobacter bilis]|nr:hypothetical protein [Helicobacter bilis]
MLTFIALHEYLESFRVLWKVVLRNDTRDSIESLANIKILGLKTTPRR